MINMKMIPCPKCGEDFPELRKTKYGYHVCVNCSTVEPLVGVTTVEGTGDHTYNDLIIMDQSRFRAIAEKEAELRGQKVHIELVDFDEDENAISQSLKEKINTALSDEEQEDQNIADPNNDNANKIQGIDY